MRVHLLLSLCSFVLICVLVCVYSGHVYVSVCTSVCVGVRVGIFARALASGSLYLCYLFQSICLAFTSIKLRISIRGTKTSLFTSAHRAPPLPQALPNLNFFSRNISFVASS